MKKLIVFFSTLIVVFCFSQEKVNDTIKSPSVRDTLSAKKTPDDVVKDINMVNATPKKIIEISPTKAGDRKSVV